MNKLNKFGVEHYSRQFGRTSGLVNKDRCRMSLGDIAVVGISGGVRPFRVAASATRYYAGEPMMRTPTYTSGQTNANNIIVLTDAKPRVATDNFVGVASRSAPGTGTVVAHTAFVAVPIPSITKLRGRGKTAANIDTDAELLLILGDLIDFDLTAAVYTLDDVGVSNASGLEIVDGNVAKQTLDVTVDARAMRTVIS